MWVARDKDGSLAIYYDYPERNESSKMWQPSKYATFIEGKFMIVEGQFYPQFKALRWEDEPIEVELTIKK